MGSRYVDAGQVGSYFVGQYYHVLKQCPDHVHQFYGDASTMIRVDGDSTETASSLMQIHTLVMSLNFTAIEIKTINSLESWNGGVMVMVSGSIKNKEFSGRRKFVQSFFLAPQEKGYFVLNDMFQFVEEEIVYQQHPAPISSENVYQQHHSAPVTPEDIHDAQLNVSSTLAEAPDSDYGLEEEAREYVNSVHIEDDPVDKYSLPEQEQDDYETEVVVEEAPVAETPASFQTALNVVPDPPVAVHEEPAEEPQKKTYASILRVLGKGQQSVATQPPATQPPVIKSPPATSDWNYVPEPPSQQPDSGSSYVPESGFEATDNLGFDEGEPKSVYVRNLPSDITAAEIEEEFRNFGRIKPDGVFIRNRKDVIGVCYAFVEFEDLASVQNAIQASPIQLAGRQVYIEERRPNSGIASRGGGRGGRGRGRGGYQADAPRGRIGARGLGGRGINQDGDYSRSRGNGYYQRSTR